MSDYLPPFTLSGEIVSLVAELGEHAGRLAVLLEHESQLRLRRINRIRTVTGSLAIEGNTLSEEQITAILDGKQVIAPPREILEAQRERGHVLYYDIDLLYSHPWLGLSALSSLKLKGFKLKGSAPSNIQFREFLDSGLRRKTSKGLLRPGSS